MATKSRTPAPSDWHDARVDAVPDSAGSEPTADDPAQAERIERFWERATAQASEWGAARHAADLGTPAAWSFGDSPDLADDLVALVLRGDKTATASAAWEYEVDDEPLPAPGDLSIVLDGSGEPQALIRTTEVTVVPFDAVSTDHAHREGEGDKSLAYWRAEHERCWRGTLAATPYEFDTTMPVVCERFEVLYPK